MALRSVIVTARHRPEGAMPERLGLVAALIVDRPLCVPCISEKTGFTADETEPFLARIATGIYVKSGTDRCRTCGRSTLVYSLFRKE